MNYDRRESFRIHDQDIIRSAFLGALELPRQALQLRGVDWIRDSVLTRRLSTEEFEIDDRGFVLRLV